MKNKKILMIIILVFALVLIGASVLYNQLGKELAPDQLSVQSAPTTGGQKETSQLQAESGEMKQEETKKPETENVGAGETESEKTLETEAAEPEKAEEKSPETEAAEPEEVEEKSPETEAAEPEKAEEKNTEAGRANGEASETGARETEAETENRISAPDFTVYTREGEEVKLSDYFGKPIVLNFWASWCGPCQMEMPDFNEKYLELKDEVNFLMINMTDGSRETVDGASEFIEEKGYEFPVFYDTDMDAAATYGAYSLPTTYFIDQDGYVIAQAKGAIDGATLQRGLDLIVE